MKDELKKKKNPPIATATVTERPGVGYYAVIKVACLTFKASSTSGAWSALNAASKKWADEHLKKYRRRFDLDERSCVVCGCTESNACLLEDNSPCSWAAPNLCSNPKCLAAKKDAQ